MKKTTFTHIKDNSDKKMAFLEPGRYVVFFYNLSGDITFDIRSKGVDLQILGLYTGKGSDSFKLNTVQNHAEGQSKSNLLVKGVFDDSAAFFYKGLIRIEKNAQKTHAYQKNQNILLSPSVFVSSRPDLEILADDVFCTHGSTTGKLSKDELFFIQSRGIDEKEAGTLLKKGFIRDVFAQMDDAGCPGQARALENDILKTYD